MFRASIYVRVSSACGRDGLARQEASMLQFIDNLGTIRSPRTFAKIDPTKNAIRMPAPTEDSTGRKSTESSYL